MKLIVGLGNPGKDYALTRHNVGWLVLDELAHRAGGTFQQKKEFEAEIADIRWQEQRVLLAKPQTFMNLSGRATQAIKSYFKIASEDILIVHDEMDFAFGRVAFMPKGGAAGHNGIKSIQESLGTPAIARCRFGIDRPTSPIRLEEYVLQRFSKQEQALLSAKIAHAADSISTWITSGLTTAMNTWNGVEHDLDEGTDRENTARSL